jgi:hypothetical protein
MKINWLTIVKDWFGLLAVVIGLVSAVGFSVSAPWPAKADVESQQKQIDAQQKQIDQQQCLILRVLLRGYQDDLDRAEDELKTNPNSTSARRDKTSAEASIADITIQLRRQNCL